MLIAYNVIYLVYFTLLRFKSSTNAIAQIKSRSSKPGVPFLSVLSFPVGCVRVVKYNKEISPSLNALL